MIPSGYFVFLTPFQGKSTAATAAKKGSAAVTEGSGDGEDEDEDDD